MLRARHERVVLELAEAVQYQQWQEAIKARRGAGAVAGQAVERYTYYERLLGRIDSDITAAASSTRWTSTRSSGCMFSQEEPEVHDSVALDLQSPRRAQSRAAGHQAQSGRRRAEQARATPRSKQVSRRSNEDESAPG